MRAEKEEKAPRGERMDETSKEAKEMQGLEWTRRG
jgi:hypothetical protein